MLATEREPVEDVVFTYLRSRFPSADPYDADTPLLEGALDSLGILELMMFLSERFGINLDDADFSPDNLGTPGRLIAFIEREQR